MYISQSEENRNRIIASVTSVAILALLILLFILIKLITPNPPFPPSGGGGGQELALGMMDVGNDNVDFSKMGEATNVVAETKPEEVSTPEKNENLLTDPEGEVIKVEEKKSETKENTTVIKPVKTPTEKPKEKTEAEKLAEKFKKNTGKPGGGIGDNDKEGQSGSPEGDPFKNGTGGHGNGTGGGDGDGDGPGTGPGKGPGSHYGISLGGRAVIQPPQLPKDTKEEGKVVVEIVVNSNGDVIEANPNGRGTTTNSPVLKQKAMKAAMATKFAVNGKFEEQRGTITIVFSFN